jgi:3-oxoacyl-[acyl-carrier protein] reductase
MVRACLPHLNAARGAIVNVSSIAGALGIGSSVPYIASKRAVNSMTLHLARSLAPQIRVNAVCPGLITTRWFGEGVGQQAYESIKQGYEQATPLGRACTAEDVAEAVLWLVDGAHTVTGELVLLDSGMHLGARGALSWLQIPEAAGKGCVPSHKLRNWNASDRPFANVS